MFENGTWPRLGGCDMSRSKKYVCLVPQHAGLISFHTLESRYHIHIALAKNAKPNFYQGGSVSEPFKTRPLQPTLRWLHSCATLLPKLLRLHAFSDSARRMEKGSINNTATSYLPIPELLTCPPGKWATSHSAFFPGFCGPASARKGS